MTESRPFPKTDKRITYFVGLSIVMHLVLLTFIQHPELLPETQEDGESILKINHLGLKPDKKNNNSIALEPIRRQITTALKPKVSQATKTPSQKVAQQKPSTQHKRLSLNDLQMPSEKIKPQGKATGLTVRPGTMPAPKTALNNGGSSGIRFANEELKKMANESYGGATVLASDKISLKYEVPDGKALDDLNEAELRLYGFLKRGAKNYTTSIATELHDFNLKYPHLQFPMTDTKQVMTGRLTYDKNGNLKQIKMVRWTNIDKLQGFFEEVLKRMDVMQNPPKELWVKDGEFNVFVTLQING